MRYVAKGWNKVKSQIFEIRDTYSFDETRNLLLGEFYYEKFFGKARNRTMMKENPKLYKSIYHHSKSLEDVMKQSERYKGSYSFMNRLKFIVEENGDTERLKCKCRKTHTWNTYCRRCPDYHYTWSGKSHTSATKRKMRITTLEYLEKTNGQLSPRYNINSIQIIEQFGKENGYNFQHAENGGEYHIKDLGYWLDAYDVKNNVVLEIDEPHHFDKNGNLRKKDKIRQREIEKFLQCKFIRKKV